MIDDSLPASTGLASDRPGRSIDWKLLFNQLFALEIKKEHLLPAGPQGSVNSLDELLEAYTQYNPASFNEALDAISGKETSEAAYEARKAFYEDPRHREVISQLNLASCVGTELFAIPKIRSFLNLITRNKDRPIAPEENFFESPEGRNVVQAFRADGANDEQEVALVFVPGYASHTIKYCIFEEIVKDANRYYGRPVERPLLREDGIDLEFEDHATYYARKNRKRHSFDILHPAGEELGNTTGFNAESTDLLYDWIQRLPESYARKKLIFLGYSKGAPIVLDLVHRHPDLAPRILGYVTYAGVIQGTHIARQFLEQAEDILRDVPIGEFIERLRESPASLGRVLSPLFADLDLSWLSLPRIRAVFDVLSYDIAPLEEQVDRVLGGREIHELLDGAQDLSPFERVRWILKHLNNETFTHPTFVFNLSALTDVKDFVRPCGLRRLSAAGSLLTPALTNEGTLDWKQLSLDALFLYVTSLDGFRTAPGGLFDTQVDLANTKMPQLDRRPLSASLTAEETAMLWDDQELRPLLQRNGVRSLKALANTPRRRLVSAERWSNIDAIDLGEFKGHHWSLFVQALRPPRELSTEHAVWDFPRKAFMRAVLQVMALYNLLQHHPLPRRKAERRKNTPDATPAAPRPTSDGKHRDVVFVRTYGSEPQRSQLINVYNLAAQAASYGLVVNSARTGLGTTPPVGPALATESLYYQAVRLFSYFDVAFRRGLLQDATLWPLPRSLAAIAGHFPAEFADMYPDEPFEQWVKVRKAMKIVAPKVEPFELRRLGPGDSTIDPAARTLSFAPAIRENLWRGTNAKLAFIEKNAYRPDAADVETKLQAMLGAFTPLSTVFAAVFDRHLPEQSYTRLTLYLPAYHTLHVEDLDRPRSWYVEKGLSHFELAPPVQIRAAEITHLRYLNRADLSQKPLGSLSQKQAIKFELRRDFEDPDQVTTVASFGSLFNSSSDELFGFDSSDYRDALYVVFRPRLAPDEWASPADWAVKGTLNPVMGGFEVEARIHQLTLQLQRDVTGIPEARREDALLRPRFSPEESRISFRVHRYVDSAVERLPLQAAGFNCAEEGGTHRFHCWRDFWTWDHFQDEFFGRPPVSSSKASLPSQLKERFLEQLVGSATRVAINRSIVSIEDAIDDQIGRIAESYLRRFTKARTVLTNRLHDQLF